jgi:hypothetical protein
MHSFPLLHALAARLGGEAGGRLHASSSRASEVLSGKLTAHGGSGAFGLPNTPPQIYALLFKRVRRRDLTVRLARWRDDEQSFANEKSTEIAPESDPRRR